MRSELFGTFALFHSMTLENKIQFLLNFLAAGHRVEQRIRRREFNHIEHTVDDFLFRETVSKGFVRQGQV